MIPERVEIKNFNCFESLVLDLRSARGTATGIVGPNGTGKSTAFSDAPLWALFGETRGDADACVRRVQSENENSGVAKGRRKGTAKSAVTASVTLYFEHDGARWKVVRTRSAGKAGKTTLSLMKQENSMWSDRSGATVRATEQAIRELLRMDASVFRATSMMVQGDSAAFCSAAPAERRAVLSSLCGLDIYGALKDSAHAKAVDLRRSADALLKASDELAEAPQRLEEAVERKRTAESEKKRLESEVESKTTAMAKLEGELRALDASIEKHVAAEKRLIELKKESETLTEQMRKVGVSGAEASEAVKAKTTECERIASETADLRLIMEKHRVAAEARELLRSRWSELASRRSDHVAERDRLGKRRDEQKSELERLERESFEVGTRAFEEKFNELLSVRARCAELRKNDPSSEERDAAEDEASAERTVSAASAALKAARRNAELMADSGCPNLVLAEASPCRFLKEAARSVAELPSLERVLSEAETALSNAKSKRAEARERVKKYFETVKADSAAADALAAMERAKNALERKNIAAAALKETLRGLREREALIAELDGEMKKVRAEGSEAAGALEEYDRAAQRHKALAEESEKAKVRLEEAERELVRCREEYLTLRARSKTIDEALKETKDETAGFDASKASELRERMVVSLGDAERTARETRIALDDMLREYGRLDGVVATAAADVERMTDLRRRGNVLMEEYDIYAQLESAFGPDGIPSDVFELVVPELSDRANDILSELTDGRMSLELRTERDLKDGRTANALEIVLSDYDGERPYETFSGGERFRIDLAVRMALAEYMASRSGGKIEWMTVDEGLGSQDDRHRALVMETVSKLAERYGTVFVITHMRDAERYFDRIVDMKELRAGQSGGHAEETEASK